MANTIEIEVKIVNSTKTGTSGVERDIKGIGVTAENVGVQVDRGFNRARDSLGRFVSQGSSGSQRVRTDFQDLDSVWDKLGEAMGRLGQSVQNGLSDLFSQAGGMDAVKQAAIGLSLAIPAVVGGFLAVGPALSIAAGAAAAAATAFVGLAGTIGVMKIGFGGIGAALTAHNQQMGGAGKAATNTAAQEQAAADRIASASRTLRDAKEAEKQASEDVTKAIADEIDRRRELAIDLESASAAQADAKQALVEAEEKNRRAQQAGSDWEKQNAANAVADAKANYDQQTEKVHDLTAEKDKAAKTSVQGSDQVQSALKREQKAQENVAVAAHALAEAKQKDATASAGAAGGVNAFADAMSKLSPNAQKLVYALLEIEKRFDVIKRKVQDHLLAGFATGVTDLADKWLPALDDILVPMADHLNSLGKAWGKALGDKGFIDNIKGAAKGFDGFIDQVKRTGTGVIDIFGRLARAGAPVLKVIGGFIEGIVTHFDKWLKAADKSGKLDDFMAGAAKNLQQIFDIIGDVAKIAGDLISIFFPSSEKNGTNALDSIDKLLKSLDKYLNDPKTRKNMQDFIDKMQQTYDFIVNDLGPIFLWLAKMAVKATGYIILAFALLWPSMKIAGRKISSVWDDIVDKAKGVFSWFGRMGSWLSSTLSGAFGGLKNGFRSVMNWVIGKWDSLNFTMPAILGGGTYGVGKIPFMATGGIANGLTMINERGGELVKLPSGSMVYPSGQSKGMAQQASGHGGGNATLYIERSGRPLEDVLIEALAGKIRKRGGNVQVVLGTRGATTT
jgi:hypothetical protein